MPKPNLMIPLEVTRSEMEAITKVRDWALGFSKRSMDKDTFLGTLAFRLALDADSLGLRLITRGIVKAESRLALAAGPKPRRSTKRR